MTVITIGSGYLSMNSDCDDHLDLKSRSGRLEVQMHLSDLVKMFYSLQRFVLLRRRQGLKINLVMETRGILGSQTVSSCNSTVLLSCARP